MIEMRILHTSHGGLPDGRIEKSALVMRDRGHEMVFLGGHPIKRQDYGAFSETHHVPVANHFRIVFDSRFKRKWLREIDEIRPDVVHAHNLIAASMMLGSDYPVVYDDHEYWSKQDFRFSSRSLVRQLVGKPLIRITPRWETEILTHYPVLTVSENIAKEHREKSKHVEVTKNFPLTAEVKGLPNPSDRKGFVYIGSDFDIERFGQHRNMTGLRDAISFDVISGVPHPQMMERLTHYKIGLTPWLPHPFHKYCDPNKNYEYLNAGLQVLITSTLKEPFQDDPYVHSFTVYEKIPSVIDQLPEQDPATIMAHARKHYVWERNEHKIRGIYSFASSSGSQ